MTLLITSCGSEITYSGFKKNLKKLVSGANDLELSSVSLKDMTSSSFGVEANITGNDQGANAVLYYCNETDSPGCNPISGTQVNMNKQTGMFDASVTGLVSPYDPNDFVNILVQIIDSEGSVVSSETRQIRLVNLVEIYRSVGPSNTTALATGAGNDLIITSSVATFASALVDNIGVGDAIEYDSDNDSIVDAVMFIHARVDSQNYTVKNADGSDVADMAVADQEWNVFRSYTSLANAENGLENTALNDAIENFDTWSGGKDLTLNNQQWNIALYADASDDYTSGITINGWTTSVSNYLHIYAPVDTTEVGASQRHLGVWDGSKFVVNLDNWSLNINNSDVVLSGVQVSQNGVGVDGTCLRMSSTRNVVIRDSICRHTQTIGSGNGIVASGALGNNFVINNIIYNVRNNGLAWACSSCVNNSLHAYNNTVVNSGGFGVTTWSNKVVLKNNIFSNNQAGSYSNPADLNSSDYNISDDALTTGGANDKSNQRIVFTNKDAYDFRLAGNSYSAIGTALDLSSDPSYIVDKDILGNMRARWDRGASTAPNTVFRSVGPSNTSSLENGAGNDLNITLNSDGHTVVSFANAIADNIGVGDVIQYDPDNIGGVDTLAFISERIDAQNYIVKNAAGANTTPTTVASQSWDIFRAYTSLADAENGVENTGILLAMRDFDTWSGGGNLVANNEQWNIAIYADNTGGVVTISGWDTSTLNKLKLYVPYLSSQVGVSQKHDGSWNGSGVKLYSNSGTVIHLQNSNTEIEGFKIEREKTNAGYSAAVHISSSINNARFSKNLIFVKTSTADGLRGVLMSVPAAEGHSIVIDNNIIFAAGTMNTNTTGMYVSYAGADGPNYYIYNNSFIGLNNGFSTINQTAASTVVYKNNLFANIAGVSIDGDTPHTSSDYNITEDGSHSGGVNDKTNQVIYFNSERTHDYRLAGNSYGAIGTARDLSRDINYSVTTDIAGNTRTRFDVGASTAPRAIFRSLGPSSTSSIENGTGNDLTIAVNGDGHTQVTFTNSINNRVGVGDVVQYDPDNSGAIDTIAFISQRIDSQNYIVKNAVGDNAIVTTMASQSWEIFRAYTSLRDAFHADENTGIDPSVINFDLITNYDLVMSNSQWNLAVYGDAPNSGVGGITESFVTSDNNYVKIYAPHLVSEVGTSQRHNGVWNSRKATLLGSGSADGIKISDTYFLRIEGLQIEVDSNDSDKAIHLNPSTSSTPPTQYHVSHNLIREATGSTGGRGIVISSGQAYVYNNIIYDFTNSGSTQNCIELRSWIGLIHLYNNTINGCNNAGISVSGSAPVDPIAKNNIALGAGVSSYSGPFDASSTHNLSDQADAPGISPFNSSSVVFLDASANDYRLNSRDINAKNVGTDLSFDDGIAFATDIIGLPRKTWDLGAHEAANMIYRSVGPSNITALETGTGNDMTIASGIATFASGIADNIGVGDAIQYDSDNDSTIDAVMFIYERIDDSNYRVQQTSGVDAADMAVADQDWSIYRAYTSLEDAERGTENTGLDDTIEDFDSWSGGRDLVANEEEWNIALYADATDTDSVSIEDWVTASSRGLRIYTPHLSSEVGTSQRHQGVWSDLFYNMKIADNSSGINIAENYVIVDGLQIRSTTSASTYRSAINLYYGHGIGNIISNNIVTNGNNTVTNRSGISVNNSQVGAAHIFNNIAYGFINSNSHGIDVDTVTDQVVYNNTLVNNDSGARCSYRGCIYSNNLAVNNTTRNHPDSDSVVSGTNNLADNTDVPGLNAVTNANVSFVNAAQNDFRLRSIDTAAKNAGADLSNDSYVSLDIDNMNHTRGSDGAWDIGAHEAATQIFRSVGPGNTTTLQAGTGNDMTISGGVATFAAALADNIGVGDVIQYDNSGDGTVDSVVFIHGRTDSQNYMVRMADGTIPGDLAAADQDWDVFRAYTSLTNAKVGTENSGLADPLENFDTWSDDKNLFATNEEWNIALYADSFDSSSIHLRGWVTASTNFLRFFAPASLTEVGVTQRHNGKWDTAKARVASSQYFGVFYTENQTTAMNHMRFEGLQVENDRAAGSGEGSALSLVALNHGNKDGELYVIGNILRKTTDSWALNQQAGLLAGGSNLTKVHYVNNIVKGFSRGFMSWTSDNIEINVYNNTFIDSTEYGVAISAGGANDTFRVKNNIAQGSGVSDYFVSETVDNPDYANNISSDATALGVGSTTDTTIQFVNATGDDYRLAQGEAVATNNGVDLSNDAAYAFTTDIVGTIRAQWDIGAFAYIDNSGLAQFNAEGDGSAGNPYIIYNKAQILDIGDDITDGCNAATNAACASSFVIAGDIDLSGETYTPIGDSTNRFTGSFDCDGKTISNLTINQPAVDYIGLIGYGESPGTFSNCNLDNFDITGNYIVGAVAGRGDMTITNVRGTNLDITGARYVGGLVGSCWGSGSDLYAEGRVTATDQNGGGIVGYTGGGDFDNIIADVDVSGGSHLGGLIGSIDNSDIDNSSATGDISGTSTIGGVIGQYGGNDSFIASNLFSTGNITGTGSEVGGVVGSMRHSMINSYATGTVRGASEVGGLIGRFWDETTDPETVTNSYALGDVIGSGTDTGGLIGFVDPSVSVVSSWAAGNVNGTGNRTGGLIGDLEGTINDSFSLGRVEGAGDKVGGFVGDVNPTGVINRSYSIGDIYVSGGGQGAGGFAGGIDGVVTKSYATGNVIAPGVQYVGGFSGSVYSSFVDVSDSYATGSVEGADTVGGFLGNANTTGSLERNYATGSVYGSQYIGGFMGSNGGSAAIISDNYAYGNSSGWQYIGGFIGSHTVGNISNSYAIGDVSGTNFVNAFAGDFTGGSLNDNFWNSDTTSASNGVEGTASVVGQYEPLATSALYDDVNFDSAQSGAWDYTNDWTQLDTRDYPIHKTSAAADCVDNLAVATYNAIGTGTLADPYIICNAQQLEDIGVNACNTGVSTDCDKVYHLGADIDLQNKDMTLIGGTTNNPFTGTFDGNNYRILNFRKVYSSDTDYLGFFLSSSGKIKNLIFERSYVEGYAKVGTLVGKDSGSQITNVKVNGSVVMKLNNIGGGGLVGESSGSSVISHAEFIGTVDAAQYVGGILGHSNVNSTGNANYILKSKSYVDIADNSIVARYGGILGRGEAEQKAIIKRSASHGHIVETTGASDIGGLVGGYATIIESYSSVSIDTVGTNSIGGLGGNSVNIYDSYSATTQIVGTSFIGGLVGDNSGNEIERSYSAVDTLTGTTVGPIIGEGNTFGNDDTFWDSDLNGITGGANNTHQDPLTSANMMVQVSFVNWDFTDVWAIGATVRAPMLRWSLHPLCQANMTATTYDAIGSGSSEDPYKICFKEQLVDLSTNGCDSDSSGGCGNFYQLLNDIDLKGITFTPIGDVTNEFTGSFDGGNYTLSNLFIDATGTNKQGMFGRTGVSSLLYNLKITLADITCGGECGVLVGEHRGVTRNVHVQGKIDSNGVGAGGLVGHMRSSSETYDSRANVAIISTSTNIGGLVGFIDGGKVDNSQAYGDVQSSDMTTTSIGGFIGSTSPNTEISNSLASGTVSGHRYVGGFIGGAGGVSTVIKNSYALGHVIATGTPAGGFVGNIADATISNCFSQGDSSDGGFVGRSRTGATIEYSYAAGTPINAGFVADEEAGTFTNNYWDNDLFNDTDSAGSYEGLATSDMDNSANFTGWDITSNWRFPAGAYPEVVPVK